MSFSVDKLSCCHCGTCVSACVCGLISFSADRTPFIELARQSICVCCGHCASVCPQAAITIDTIDTHKLAATHASVPENITTSLLTERRAMRNFLPSKVDENLLKKAFSLVAYAPTAHNAREVSYIVINDRGKVEKLLLATTEHMEAHNMFPGHTNNVRNGRDSLFRGAPCLILIHAPERILSETDCATAAAYLELAFPSLQLGSCWAGMLLESCAHGLPKGITIPEGNKLYAALMVGTPNIAYKRIPFRAEVNVTWA